MAHRKRLLLFGTCCVFLATCTLTLMRSNLNWRAHLSAHASRYLSQDGCQEDLAAAQLRLAVECKTAQTAQLGLAHAKLDAANASIRRLEDALAEARAQNRQLTDMRESAEQKSTSQSAELAEKDSSMAKLQAKFEAAKKEWRTWQSEKVAQLQAGQQKSEEMLDKVITGSRSSEDRHKQTIAELRAKLDAAQKETAQWQAAKLESALKQLEEGETTTTKPKNSAIAGSRPSEDRQKQTIAEPPTKLDTAVQKETAPWQASRLRSAPKQLVVGETATSSSSSSSAPSASASTPAAGFAASSAGCDCEWATKEACAAGPDGTACNDVCCESWRGAARAVTGATEASV